MISFVKKMTALTYILNKKHPILNFLRFLIKALYLNVNFDIQ